MNDTLTDPVRAFLAALPDRLRHHVRLSVQGVADVHTALRTHTPAELARLVAFGDAAGYWHPSSLVHARLHKAAGHPIDETTGGGLDD